MLHRQLGDFEVDFGVDLVAFGRDQAVDELEQFVSGGHADLEALALIVQRRGGELGGDPGGLRRLEVGLQAVERGLHVNHDLRDQVAIAHSLLLVCHPGLGQGCLGGIVAQRTLEIEDDRIIVEAERPQPIQRFRVASLEG